MAKRSREAFEPLSEDSTSQESPAALSVPHSSTPTPSPKLLLLDPASPRGKARLELEMRCSLPPHRETLTFPSPESYEIHYKKTHLHRCLECRKNFPTEHFLNLHIHENHDALIKVRKERGEKTYSCFVEDCEKKCFTPQKRRMHLIDKHLFPRDYDFYIVNDGIDNRTTMLRSGRHRRRSSAAQHLGEIEERAKRRGSKLCTIEGVSAGGEDDKITAEGVKSTPPDSDIEGLTGAMSALRFVPPSVRFGRGRGRGRGGFSRT